MACLVDRLTQKEAKSAPTKNPIKTFQNLSGGIRPCINQQRCRKVQWCRTRGDRLWKHHQFGCPHPKSISWCYQSNRIKELYAGAHLQTPHSRHRRFDYLMDAFELINEWERYRHISPMDFSSTISIECMKLRVSEHAARLMNGDESAEEFSVMLEKYENQISEYILRFGTSG